MPFLDDREFRRRLERLAAWWRGGLADGPLVQVIVPPDRETAERLSRKHQPPAGDAEKLFRWWADPAVVIPRVEEALEARTYLGDVWPHHFVNLGPGALAAFMGCRSVPQATTVWQEPLIGRWDAAPELVLHEDNPWWLAARELTRASIRASRGRWLTSFTDIGGAMDITSYFRTPERLCMDLVECPDNVRRSEEAVLKAWFQVYDRLYPQLLAASGGSCGWIGLWYPGRTYPLQCDFSCMISPEMFREHGLPFLERQAAGLDNAIYHLDGPGAVRHLDAICEVPHIRAIQWVPGAGTSHAVADWLDLYRRILDHGRGVLLYCTEDDLDLVFDRLDVDRLILGIGARDLAEGERIMARIDRLRRGRKRVQ